MRQYISSLIKKLYTHIIMLSPSYSSFKNDICIKERCQEADNEKSKSQASIAYRCLNVVILDEDIVIYLYYVITYLPLLHGSSSDLSFFKLSVIRKIRFCDVVLFFGLYYFHITITSRQLKCN